jgi:hypothetical protein
VSILTYKRCHLAIGEEIGGVGGQLSGEAILEEIHVPHNPQPLKKVRERVSQC